MQKERYSQDKTHKSFEKWRNNVERSFEERKSSVDNNHIKNMLTFKDREIPEIKPCLAVAFVNVQIDGPPC